MRASLSVTLALLSTVPVFAAEEPSGCDNFKWPIDRERAALTAPDRAKLASGSEQATLPSPAITLALVAPADAKLPLPPERAPKDGTFAGFASFKTAPKAGVYTISLSIGAISMGWFSLSFLGSNLLASRGRIPRPRQAV
jgi:hypothetical protein